MDVTFNTQKDFVFFFPQWNISTPRAYGLIIILLMLLGILSRFIVARKSQLERTWRENSTYESTRSSHSARNKQQRQSMLQDRSEDEIELLNLDPVAGNEEYEDDQTLLESDLRLNSGPRKWKHEAIRAFLSCFHLFLAYLLMFAVMTYHVGIFFAVIGSIFLGDLMFGRYAYQKELVWGTTENGDQQYTLREVL